MHLSVEFWLAILASVPIGIGTALVTPSIQHWLDARSKKRSLIRTRNFEAEYKLVLFYRDNPNEFTHFLVQTAIKTTFISAVIAVLSGLSVGFASLTAALDSLVLPIGHVRESFILLLASVGQLGASFGSIMIFQVCQKALSIWTKVKNFEEYSESMGKVISAGPDPTA